MIHNLQTFRSHFCKQVIRIFKTIIRIFTAPLRFLTYFWQTTECEGCTRVTKGKHSTSFRHIMIRMHLSLAFNRHFYLFNNFTCPCLSKDSDGSHIMSDQEQLMSKLISKTPKTHEQHDLLHDSPTEIQYSWLLINEEYRRRNTQKATCKVATL